ncbi:class I SAM-dependent methyltransferase [Thioalkalivibrio paradoxus]|uniref:Methyltransferase domain-containing protein n=1 Tax=Thioalkalivibrio paradoxus ARh 1 TaxID=713585 RepID=W0DMJ8_9GAMM|nr:class I SAM-dependent methyltransferase [Thioalkalivibrio paradoxus]AHE99814.1 hypothetical protein THITH_00695 [Thioalkalivibrio paradoxus ARh 1]
MPTVDANKRLWDGGYNWGRGGDEWSDPWGGTVPQWRFLILPRIQSFLPADTILEIAPGFGRWTSFLSGCCNRLEMVDLSEACIAACKERFQGLRTMGYHVNDGYSLGMIGDRSIDFAFSFDSLVHAEADVLDSYLGQLAMKLKPDGVGFFHHSAMGIHREELDAIERIPNQLRSAVVQPRWLIRNHMRARNVSPAVFEELCSKHSLQCIGQEVVNWRESVLTDCFSTFTLRSSSWARENRVIENLEFMRDAERIKQLASLYMHKKVLEG